MPRTNRQVMATTTLNASMSSLIERRVAAFARHSGKLKRPGTPDAGPHVPFRTLSPPGQASG
jgi:hypothetical protein